MPQITTTISEETVKELNARLSAKNSPYQILVQQYPGIEYGTDMQVETPIQQPQPFIVGEVIHTNDSAINQSFTDVVSQSYEVAQTFSITAGLKSSFSIKGKTDFLILGAETTASVELSLTAGFTHSTKETITLQKSIPLIAPPHSKVTMQVIGQILKVSNVPFTIDVTVGNGNWKIYTTDMLPVYRKFARGNHFYTTTPQEGEVHGYVNEGILGFVYMTQQSGTVPVYRKFGSGDHFYTTNLQEGKDQGYQDEGILGYVYPKQVDKTIPVYRKYNGKDHFYTTNLQEGKDQGYQDEGILGYIYPQTGLNQSLDSILSESDRTFRSTGIFNGTLINQKTEIAIKQEERPPVKIPAHAAISSQGNSLVSTERTPAALLSTSNIIEVSRVR
ncbi:MAG: ETX/MTX2 family pore-forming toxin [Leptolyngbya sp. UWPOB_LEPTO1]|uniref:ETX/MTX2 family pore-forming toxin n=1 Tax=Leptolyngbya sp. UWPOB_LEPTO1 TaxID=2815653 RepID=UPI001AC5BAF2|nr:ETX/MTX2 family pore-forming toxin [Leptolyngbya sp. UWPOB_LEPTO1]MBN8563067.1 ETX/MTX2 family pore-forming toxin [Leptolyngbya sp. UWPOB_LEPTO1]